MTALIISDLHLSVDRPDLMQAFEQFLDNHARHASKLYILGDLFEVWLGDDDLTEFNQAVIQAIRRLSDTGVEVFIMHGNRDFMLGRAFAKATASTLLKDPCIHTIAGHQVLLSHGDCYCTDDIVYQKTKKRIRNPIVLPILRALPLATRQKIAGGLRDKSAQDKQCTSMQIMDVTDTAITEAFRQHKVELMIHGHTHRPQIHQHGHCTRYVLGDWGKSVWYIAIDEHTMALTQYDNPFYPK